MTETAMRGMIGAAMLMTGGSLAAQDMPPAATCSVPMTAPTPWTGWSSPAPVVASEQSDARSGAMLIPGRAVSLTLAPTRDVAFVVPPAKPAGPTSYAGLAMLLVPVAGTYRVAAGAPVWIEMVRDGRSIASVAHDHGPACSGIVKTVDFVLPVGTATIELSGAPTPVTTAMVVRVS